MRGRPGCPTGQKKNSVGATAGSPLFYFYKERLGTKSPPHPPQCAHWGTFPPRGRLWTWECLFPSEKPPPPARPAGGRAVTNVGLWAAGQSRNIEKTSPWPPTRERWVQGGRTSSSLALFPPAFSGESRAPARGRAGNGALRPKASEEPRPPEGYVVLHARPTGGPPLTPPAAGRRPGHAPPVGSPAPPGRAPRPQWCWGARPG